MRKLVCEAQTVVIVAVLHFFFLIAVLNKENVYTLCRVIYAFKGCNWG